MGSTILQRAMLGDVDAARSEAAKYGKPVRVTKAVREWFARADAQGSPDKLERVIAAMFAVAIGGDVGAAKLLLNYLEPREPLWRVGTQYNVIAGEPGTVLAALQKVRASLEGVGPQREMIDVDASIPSDS